MKTLVAKTANSSKDSRLRKSLLKPDLGAVRISGKSLKANMVCPPEISEKTGGIIRSLYCIRSQMTCASHSVLSSSSKEKRLASQCSHRSIHCAASLSTCVFAVDVACVGVSQTATPTSGRKSRQ